MMATRPTTVVSTKGQIVLPKAIREPRGWRAGSRLVFEDTAEGVLLRSDIQGPALGVDDVYGALRPYVREPLSDAEIKSRLRAAAKRRHAGD
jgi:AbrB family looped-hinge helix DNA binding protein